MWYLILNTSNLTFLWGSCIDCTSISTGKRGGGGGVVVMGNNAVVDLDLGGASSNAEEGSS